MMDISKLPHQQSQKEQTMKPSCAAPQNLQSTAWLAHLHFSFNPYETLTAFQDEQLGLYIIHHDLYRYGLEKQTAWFYALSGGGKTGMSLAIARSCWVSLVDHSIFPILYYLPSHMNDYVPVDASQHFRWLTVAAAKSLFAGLTYRPQKFLGLPAPSQRIIAGFFEQAFKIEGVFGLSYYADFLGELNDPSQMLRLLQWPNILSSAPPLHFVREFGQALKKAYQPALSTIERPLLDWMDIVTQTMGFKNSIILIDGVDHFYDSIREPQNAVQLLRPLIEQEEKLARHHLYLKFFLPSDLKDLLMSQLGTENQDLRYDLVWTVDKLVEMIYARTKIASNGSILSLDAVSSPGVRNFEETLAKQIPTPLPREMLIIVNHVLNAYAERTSGTFTHIATADIENGIKTYRAQLPSTYKKIPRGNDD